jgi:DNA mismatch repair ATPase MutS
MNPETTAFYEENIKISNQRIQELARKSNMLSLFRLLIIVGGAILIFQVVQTEDVLLTLVSFIITVLLFLTLVLFQSKNTAKKRAVERFLHINKNELTVAEDIKKNLYDSGQSYVDDQHIYTSDLDIFGEGSIFQMINRCATLHGNNLLSNWFSHPANKAEIEDRQQFVHELASNFSWWQDVQAKLYAVRGSKIDAKKLISHYLVSEIKFSKSKILAFYTKIAPYPFIILFALSFYQSSFISIIILLAIFNLLLSMVLSGKVNVVSSGLNKGGEFLASYIPALKKVEERAWESKQAKEMQKHVEEVSGMPVSKSIERLAVLLNRLDARLNIAVGIVLNMFLLWDFRQVYALQNWQNMQSKGILEAMDMLSLVEAVGSLAALKFNHPDWTIPEIASDFPTVEVKNIKHPLIPLATSIANDYSLEEHRIALITGSNMAGKSTFLRTIGVNAVLALSGAPVCANYMKISVMQMATYMRIRDSLNESTSTFKAELDRIQKILELVKNHKNTFILLDEMLRGTNSMDKYLGSKAIIEKLIEQKGVGMVATHDLKLSELSDKYPQIVKNFHFDIKVEGEEMLFDYKLKTGPCTTFNASLLLKKIGIEI